MGDNETIQTALTAAKTGHLLFSTLHTIGAANTIDCIVDAFSTNQQQIRHNFLWFLKLLFLNNYYQVLMAG